MATMTRTKESSLVDTVKDLLNPYEEFYIAKDTPGVAGYMLTLKTHIYVHRKYAKRDLFIPQTFYQAMTTTVLPNKTFIAEWL